ncbi:MAG: hypothetical protein EP305_04220 [Bacteroidetes bacterium]|nr:MAG: hypothetical protein EP305_04220 [Bacteroidota bacterium]
MRFLFLIVTLYFLNSCNSTNEKVDSTTNDTSIFDHTEQSINTETNQISTKKLPGYVSPDSSWSVSLTIEEGNLTEFIIHNKDGQINTTELKVPNDLIGGVDFTTVNWTKSGNLLIPNVGGTSDGYYELTINKKGIYNYKKRILEVLTEDQVVIMNPKVQNKPIPSINASYSQNANVTTFNYSYRYSDPSIGCSNNEHSFSFEITTNESNFELMGDQLKNINFKYHLTGGLLFQDSKDILDGYISGKKNPDNSWTVHVKVIFTVSQVPVQSEENLTRTIDQKDTYLLD